MRTDAGTRPQRSVTLLLLALLVTASCGESEPSTRSAGITSTVAASSGLVSLHIVSRNSPRFISSGSVSGGANGQPALWESSAVPAWLSYDLSTTPVTQRQTMLVTLLSPGSYPYLNPTQQQAFPQSFTIEGNSLPGGTSSPTQGWQALATVASNNMNSPQVVVNLAGANWIRVRVQGSSESQRVIAAVDVYSTPPVPDDDWLFLGDSITVGFCSTELAFRVNQLQVARWPAIVCAAVGGTSTVTAAVDIDKVLATFPGRFVVLAYGTNDSATNFKMETLVQRVLAVGKVPVVPHMPWSNVNTPQGLAINALIDALYTKYPTIVRGPDLYQAFLNRADLFSAPNDVHPNEQGQILLRQLWASTIAARDIALNSAAETASLRPAVRLRRPT